MPSAKKLDWAALKAENDARKKKSAAGAAKRKAEGRKAYDESGAKKQVEGMPNRKNKPKAPKPKKKTPKQNRKDLEKEYL